MEKYKLPEINLVEIIQEGYGKLQVGRKHYYGKMVNKIIPIENGFGALDKDGKMFVAFYNCPMVVVFKKEG